MVLANKHNEKINETFSTINSVKIQTFFKYFEGMLDVSLI